ncbi:MAG TPA: hypothetical protein VGF71_13735 [Caulobacteraceae bacterium]|jgi:hypothetical protein
MHEPPDLKPIIDAVSRAIVEAYRKGIADGTEMALNGILAAVNAKVEAIAASAGKPTLLGGGMPPTLETKREAAKPEPTNREDVADSFTPVRQRAPRGLIDEVLEDVLAFAPGLSLAAIERAVLEEEPRIARRSVFNRLRLHEQNSGRYQRVNGHWYRKQDVPKQPNMFQEAAEESAFADEGAFT